MTVSSWVLCAPPDGASEGPPCSARLRLFLSLPADIGVAFSLGKVILVGITGTFPANFPPFSFFETLLMSKIDPICFAGFLRFFSSKKWLESFLWGHYGVVLGSFTLFESLWSGITLPQGNF